MKINGVLFIAVFLAVASCAVTAAYASSNFTAAANQQSTEKWEQFARRGGGHGGRGGFEDGLWHRSSHGDHAQIEDNRFGTDDHSGFDDSGHHGGENHFEDHGQHRSGGENHLRSHDHSEFDDSGHHGGSHR